MYIYTYFSKECYNYGCQFTYRKFNMEIEFRNYLVNLVYNKVISSYNKFPGILNGLKIHYVFFCYAKYRFPLDSCARAFDIV